MTEQVDLDALIAEARKITTHGVTDVDLVLRLADALESTHAELRQERERVNRRVGGRELARLRTALSRAEETIARALEPKNIDYGHIDVALDRVRAILTEYDKQKSTPVESDNQG